VQEHGCLQIIVRLRWTLDLVRRLHRHTVCRPEAEGGEVGWHSTAKLVEDTKNAVLCVIYCRLFHSERQGWTAFFRRFRLNSERRMVTCNMLPVQSFFIKTCLSRQSIH